eukprot:gnl/TRDRNA2_/TRDRNA2_212259_c0_seq1.p1 gnl/TRDRNA2_/TRDRNA2_212259_c0~~gnl/TRDRNA2_/TRDRNA2_212259_c0_seq1.p1  ORF type:complete len:265 (+),score=40.48 gnl/TRDRNA2_/TRDRNA2_212259_c0_seq1:1-795(+)
MLPLCDDTCAMAVLDAAGSFCDLGDDGSKVCDLNDDCKTKFCAIKTECSCDKPVLGMDAAEWKKGCDSSMAKETECPCVDMPPECKAAAEAMGPPETCNMKGGFDPEILCSSSCEPELKKFGEACKDLAATPDSDAAKAYNLMTTLCDDKCALSFLKVSLNKNEECQFKGSAPPPEVACLETCRDTLFCPLGQCDGDKQPEALRGQTMSPQAWKQIVANMKDATSDCEPKCGAIGDTSAGWRHTQILAIFYLTALALLLTLARA